MTSLMEERASIKKHQKTRDYKRMTKAQKKRAQAFYILLEQELLKKYTNGDSPWLEGLKDIVFSDT